MASLVPPVVIKASSRHTATMIFLHGLGDTGMGWAGALNTIKPGYMKVICPTAPIVPVTLNGGMQMPAWYDIMSLDPNDRNREDMDGVETAYRNLKGLIDTETSQLAIPRERIIIGGFSQGGAVALYTLLKEEQRLGGCVALSTYLPGSIDSYKDSVKHATPVLQCHGETDEIVPFNRGQQTNEALKKFVDDLTFQGYSNMGHEAVPDELELVKDFITKHVPEKND